MFKIGDFALCPGHGVGQIAGIEEKSVGPQRCRFYIVQLSKNGMKVLVPEQEEAHQMKVLATDCEIQEALLVLTAKDDTVLKAVNWGQRYREYMTKIKSGRITATADVLRSLSLLRQRKGLNFGERKMLGLCRDLMAQEIAYSLGEQLDAAYHRIDACMAE